MPTVSRYPKLDIPNVNLWDFLFLRSDRKYPDDKVIFSDSDTKRAYTFRELRDASIQFGSGLLAKHKWTKGDVVALFSPNDVDYPTVMWGTLWAGGVVSLVNSNYTASELEFQLVDSGAKLLVTHVSLLPTVLVAVKKLGFTRSKILLLGDERSSRSSEFKHFKSLRGPAHLSMPHVLDPKEDLCFLVYSSGTTGKPKGVMLTHHNIISNISMIAQSEDGNLSWNSGPSGKGDSMVGFLPFFHSYGLTAVVHVGLYLGIEIIVMPKFDLDKYCAIIERRKVTFAAVVPPVVLLLGKSPIVDKYNLSSLRMISSGAAPLTKELVGIVRKKLNVPVRQGYGLSETSPVTHQQVSDKNVSYLAKMLMISPRKPWDAPGQPVGSIGTLLANQTSKFVTSSGQEVPAGEPGELCVKGPNVFRGYLNNPVKTKESFTTDGYFKTGDIGYQDQDGNVYITDRSKELIKYNAFQVAPAELEGVLTAHPKVTDAAVVGVHDEQRATEVPQAYVVVAAGVARNEDTPERFKRGCEITSRATSSSEEGSGILTPSQSRQQGKILRSKLRELTREEAMKLLSPKL